MQFFERIIGFISSKLQRFMCAITVRKILGVPALANRVKLFSWRKFDGAIRSSLMRAITERLIF